MELFSFRILVNVDSNSGCVALVSLCKLYIFVCGMDTTEDEQSSSETAETEIGGITKPGIELRLCLTIPVVPLSFAENLPDFASFLSIHNFPSSFEYAIVSFLIEQPSSKKEVILWTKQQIHQVFKNLSLYISIFFLFFS